MCFSSPQLFIMAVSYSTVCIFPPDHSTPDCHDLVYEVDLQYSKETFLSVALMQVSLRPEKNRLGRSRSR